MLSSTLSKVALPLLGIALVLGISRLRGLSWRDNLGLRRPSWRQAALWLGVWIAWLAVAEALIHLLGLDQAKPWPSYPALVVALRILAIGVFGPAAEELIFRGLLYDRLVRTRAGARGAIVIPALVWAAIHVSYGPGTLLLIAADGILLGIARHRSGSIWVPIAMHVTGNLFSIAQSLSA
jgi:membrane protease YdiL (CAAX protease family)